MSHPSRVLHTFLVVEQLLEAVQFGDVKVRREGEGLGITESQERGRGIVGECRWGQERGGGVRKYRGE